MIGRRMPWESSMFSSFISSVFAGFVAPGVSGEEDGNGVGSGSGASATVLLLVGPKPRPLM